MFRISRTDIRKAGELAEIHATGFPMPWNQSAIRGFVEDNTVFSLMAFQPKGNQLSGFIMTRFVKDEADILTVAVAPKMQRQGVGYGLCHATMRHLSTQGVKKVHLEVSAVNLGAIHLYKRLGFYQVGARPHYYQGKNGGRREDAIRMSLDMKSATFQFEPVTYLLDQF